MHWLGCNDAVPLNKVKTRPTANFKNFENNLYFICQPACITPSYARCRAPEISHDKGNGGGFMKMLFEDNLPTVP